MIVYIFIAVAHKRSQSFCQKCRWQVPSKHTCTYANNVQSTPIQWIFKTHYESYSHWFKHMWQKLSESAQEWRIMLYKNDLHTCVCIYIYACWFLCVCVDFTHLFTMCCGEELAQQSSCVLALQVATEITDNYIVYLCSMLWISHAWAKNELNPQSVPTTPWYLSVLVH